MKTVWNIFWHDLKTLVRNPLALILALVAIALPSACAWYSVATQWNPYGHIDELKIALVNEDAGVNKEELPTKTAVETDAQLLAKRVDETGSLNIGSLVVEAAHNDSSVNWQPVSAEQGESGLDSGEYYAELVIPADFTDKLLNVLSGNPEQPTIECWINGKYRGSAFDMSNAGANVADEKIHQKISAFVASSLASTLEGTSGAALVGKNTTNPSVYAGLDGAEQDLKTVRESLERAKASVNQWSTDTEGARKKLDELKSTAPKLRTALDDAQELLTDARTEAHQVSSSYGTALAVGDKGLSEVLVEVSERIGNATTLMSNNQKELASELAKTEKAISECERLITALIKIDPKSSTLADLKKQNENLQDELADLQELSNSMGSAADSAAGVANDLSKDVNNAVKALQRQTDAFNEKTLPQLDTSLDSLAIAMGTLQGALASLDAQIAQTETLLTDLDSVLRQTDEEATTALESLDKAAKDLQSARADIASLANAKAVQDVSSLTNAGASNFALFESSPINATVQETYSVNSYGAGTAPFYACLALWAGCFLLMAITKLEADPQAFPGIRPWQRVLGRLTLIGFLALLQSVAITAGYIALGVSPTSAVALVAAGIVTAFCFVNITYALALTFKHVGKALVIMLLVVQLVVAAQTYPAQLMPEAVQAIIPWLPFTYGMGALSEAIGGFYGLDYVRDILWLLACGLATFGLAMLVRQRMLRLDRALDPKIERAGLFASEPSAANPGADDNLSLALTANKLADDEEERTLLKARMRKNSQRYPIIRNAAPLAAITLVATLGIVSMLLPLSADDKTYALLAFILAITVACIFALAFEYSHGFTTTLLAKAGVNLDTMIPAITPTPTAASTTAPIAPISPTEKATSSTTDEQGGFVELVPDEWTTNSSWNGTLIEAWNVGAVEELDAALAEEQENTTAEERVDTAAETQEAEPIEEPDETSIDSLSDEETEKPDDDESGSELNSQSAQALKPESGQTREPEADEPTNEHIDEEDADA